VITLASPRAIKAPFSVPCPALESRCRRESPRTDSPDRADKSLPGLGLFYHRVKPAKTHQFRRARGLNMDIPLSLIHSISIKPAVNEGGTANAFGRPHTFPTKLRAAFPIGRKISNRLEIECRRYAGSVGKVDRKWGEARRVMLFLEAMQRAQPVMEKRLRLQAAFKD
jgi:hypothetical protein